MDGWHLAFLVSNDSPVATDNFPFVQAPVTVISQSRSKLQLPLIPIVSFLVSAVTSFGFTSIVSVRKLFSSSASITSPLGFPVLTGSIVAAITHLPSLSIALAGIFPVNTGVVCPMR